MLNNACVPDMCNRKFLNFVKHLGSNAAELAGPIRMERAPGNTIFICISKDSQQYLINDKLACLSHNSNQLLFSAPVIALNRLIQARTNLPVKYLLEVVILRISHILFGSLIILRSNIMHQVIKDLLHFICMDIYTTRRDLASLRILHILQVQ